jgi:hypothetical protein
MRRHRRLGNRFRAIGLHARFFGRRRLVFERDVNRRDFRRSSFRDRATERCKKRNMEHARGQHGPREARRFGRWMHVLQNLLLEKLRVASRKTRPIVNSS